jgi:hypothetical protein
LKPLVVSFYTPDNEFSVWIKTLEASALRFGFETDIQARELPSGWASRAAFKGQFMWEMMQKHQRKLLWLDADSEIVAPLEIFDAPEWDFACQYVGDLQRFRTGTVYVAPEASSLLEAAAVLCAKRPTWAHERNFTEAWVQTSLDYRTFFLDARYNAAKWKHSEPPEDAFIKSNHISNGGQRNATQA